MLDRLPSTEKRNRSRFDGVGRDFAQPSHLQEFSPAAE